MNKIWRVNVRHSTFEHLAYPTDDCEDPISVIHSLRQAPSDPDRDIGIHGGRVNTDVVESVELTMLREDFEDDYFTWGGCMFVSEKLRNAMALDVSVVAFSEVDDSKSAALPRSKKYQLMLPLLEDDVSQESLRPPKDGAFLHSTSIVIRPDFEPDCDLFYDSVFADGLFCTDALALRVLEAGCVGMSFVDPIGHRNGVSPVRRTLAGVEEDAFD